MDSATDSESTSELGLLWPPEDARASMADVFTSVFCFKVCNLANGMISQSAGLCHTVVCDVAL